MIKKIAILLFILILSSFAYYKYSVCPLNIENSSLENKSRNFLEMEPSALSPAYCEGLPTKNEADICTITLIGFAVEGKTLTKETCLEIKDTQNQIDCFSYYSELNNDTTICLRIEDKPQRDACLGHLKRISQPDFPIESDEKCLALQKAGYQLWHDQCMLSYVVKQKIVDEKVCEHIVKPQSFYNCVKNAALNKKDENLCTYVNKKAPYPANYPPIVFSESGCRYFVKHGGSYEGISLK